MTQTTKKHPLQELLENTDGIELRSYSGRMMFGRSCLAITGDLSDLLGKLMQAMLWARDRDLSDWERQRVSDVLERGIAFDSMGLHSVVYFPSVPFVDEEDEEEQDEIDEDDE